MANEVMGILLLVMTFIHLTVSVVQGTRLGTWVVYVNSRVLAKTIKEEYHKGRRLNKLDKNAFANLKGLRIGLMTVEDGEVTAKRVDDIIDVLTESFVYIDDVTYVDMDKLDMKPVLVDKFLEGYIDKLFLDPYNQDNWWVKVKERTLQSVITVVVTTTNYLPMLVVYIHGSTTAFLYTFALAGVVVCSTLDYIATLEGVVTTGVQRSRYKIFVKFMKFQIIPLSVVAVIYFINLIVSVI